MKKLLLGSIVLAATSLAALAADMPIKAPPAPAYSWTGLYVNGGFGYGMWSADTTVVNDSGACLHCTPMRSGGRGWLGTVGIGADFQAGSHIVVGAFFDYDLASIRGSVVDPGPNGGLVAPVKLTQAWSVGARAGWLITPAILSYFNGGYTNARFTSGEGLRTGNGAPQGVTYQPFTTGGWFLGSGMEVTFAPGWFWRNEYRLAHYSTKNLVPCLDTTGGCGLVGTGGFAGNITFDPWVQTLRTEVVHKFNWGG